MITHATPRGFVALMSVIIISAILLILMFTLGTSSFFSRFDALDAENKRVSLGLAEACVNAAILKLAQDDLTVGQVIVDASDPQKTCRICTLSAGGALVTRAVYNSAYTNLDVTVDPNAGTYPITNWKETGVTSVPSCTLP